MDRVLIFAPKPGRVGGMEMHLVRLARLYATHGCKVTFVATGNSLDQKFKDSMAEAGVEWLSPGKPSRDVRLHDAAFFFLRVWLRLRLQSWKLILTNSHSFWAFACWLLASPGTRIAHHHHTTGDLPEQRHWSRWYFFLLRHAPLVLTCSDVSRECIRALGVRGEVRTMPYLIDESLAPRSSPRRPGPYRFGYLGRLIRTKGIDRIIELCALPDLGNVEWLLYGSLGDYREEDFAGRERLRYCGTYSSGENLQAILDDLDAMVLFSEHAEGMPVSLLEASAAGLPWIASDIGGTAELARGNESNELVPRAPSLEECHQAVKKLLASLEKSASGNRRMAIAPHFAFPVASQNWLALLKDAKSADASPE